MEACRDGNNRNVGGGKGSRKGTPQGGVISPLLSNIYLHLLDRTWVRQHLEKRLGARLVPYAEDFVVLCKVGTEVPMKAISRLLSRLELSLNESKTKVLDAQVSNFDFLGFELRIGKSLSTGNSFPYVQPSKKSLGRIKDRVTRLTCRKRTPVTLDRIMRESNSSLQGWVGYFHYRNSSRSLSHLKYHVEEQLRTPLRKRHKVKERASGYKRFSSGGLYGKYRLYKVPTTAGWKKANAFG